VTDLSEVAQAAVDIAGVESAAIFASHAGSAALELAAAAGINGPPLDGLVAAVQDPVHPIARAMHDVSPTFDVRPTNPGGPALRSHLPLGGRGVLAVAHDGNLGAEDRATLDQLASKATDLLRG
jgi:hypothetical protein